MLDYRFKPIASWPGKMTPPYQRRETVFKDSKTGRVAPLSDTLAMLETELGKLRAKGVIVQLAYSEADLHRVLRRDGRLLADAKRPQHPGVILTFDSKFGPLSYPCDHFTQWESNLRAIAHHLNHVRMASAYGVGQYGEAYRGFAALPPAPAAPDEADPKRAAARLLLRLARLTETEESIRRVVEDPTERRSVYSKAVLKTHPDTGGSADWFRAAHEANTKLGGAR